MSFFSGLKTEGLEESTDRVGGGGFVLDSDIYSGKIKMAYGGVADSGAKFVHFEFEFEGGKKFSQDVYFTNKEGKNFWERKDEKTGKTTEVPLPGYTVVEELVMIVTGDTLAKLRLEDKMVNVYDKDATTANKQVPKSVPVMVDLLDQPISLAIMKNLENKTENQNGKYVPVAETRQTNTIEKVLHTESHMTVPEGRTGAEKATFWDEWLKNWKGKERDKRKLKDGQGGTPGRPGAPKTPAGPPQASGTAATPRRSIFGPKS